MRSGTARAGGAADPIDGPHAWFRLGVSLTLGTIGSIGMWAVIVVLPTVQAEFGVDRADASLPFTLAMIGFAVANVVGGRYVDRVGIVAPVIAAALALGIGFVGAALTASIWQFALFHGLFIGVGAAIGFGPLIANVSHWFRRRRGIAVAATASGNYLAGVIWPVVLQAIVDTEGWRTAYVAAGAMCVALMVPLALLLRRPLPLTEAPAAVDAGAGSGALKQIDMPRGALLALLGIAGVACCVAMSMPQVHIVAYCADLGYGVARGAEMLSLMLAGGIVSRLVSGFLADVIGGVRTLLLGSVLQCLALFFYLPFDGLVSLYVVSLLFGLAQGGIIPSYAIIVREFMPAREAGQHVGFLIMATICGMALGGWMSGWIYDLTGSYRAAFANGIGWNLVNIGIMALVLWRTRPRTGAPATA